MTMMFQPPAGAAVVEGVDTVIDQMVRHFDRAVKAVDDVIERMSAGEMVPSSETKRAVAEARTAMQSLLTERQRVLDERRKRGEDVDGGSLDFAAARAQVSGELDRLRAAYAAG